MCRFGYEVRQEDGGKTRFDEELPLSVQKARIVMADEHERDLSDRRLPYHLVSGTLEV
jgi:hypothetical protein